MNKRSEDKIFDLIYKVNRACVHDKLRRMAENANYIKIKGTRNLASAHSFRNAFSTELTGTINDSFIEYMLGHDLGSMIQTRAR